ncbi:hypothetical protein J2T13_000884 [Paenibacillus sp. DS2015]
MGAVYELFLRNWVNSRASVAQIELAVTRGFITLEESQTIMGTEPNPQ